MSILSKLRVAAVVAAGVLASACGGSSASSSSLPPGYYIVISNMSFAPLNLAAPSGATVTVINRDSMTHSVTQQAAAAAFTLGAPSGTTPFDTGLFTGTRTFTLPAGLADGTVLHYYCSNHTSTMLTPNGTITIAAAAQPGGGIDPGPGGGY
ncbi:MAG: blue (type 1) copper domain [Anaeromyxobacteraceae bacterium]|nr:blue (type 1) copper domain [Anaeromyxobacteraceae bacterium]